MRRTDQDRAGTIGTIDVEASDFWNRRGMRTDPTQVAAAPGAPLLLLAVLAAVGGGVLLPRPCSAWFAPQARLLGRPVRGVPVPAECGGVPDPFALLETVRRAREEGDEPRLLVLSVADDVTGTAAPPELLHEVCEAAAGEGLVLVSDESWRDTSHDPHDTVTVSPVEMMEGTPHADAVVVLAALGAALLAPGLHAGVARFPAHGRGRALGEEVRGILAALHTELSDPVAAAAAEALSEPEDERRRRAEAARLHGERGAALCRAVTDAGALCRPPHAGRHLYADMEQARSRLAARGITDAAGLEAELVRRLGPYADGGHRFGDDPRALRVRLATDVLAEVRGSPLTTQDGRAAQESLGAAQALVTVQSVLADLTDGSPQ
ncbi:aminotransferase class I/II-fold pyridoxal phosphate-dependent enzyme [Streptomyces albiaxialis]|uniref:Aminotransferase class I/II-fold pyridoxal phosphate-dependent enzyme n=1 Tax=Streptomyces albiaxialis TaxID=329523 RepID=A0ABN2WP05_9ACTN